MGDVLRRQIIETALAMNATGLSHGVSGNISARDGDGMLITPSGMDYAGMEPSDIVRMELDGAYDGPHRPSSEWRFHAAIYRERPEAQTVLHAHPMYCTTLACTHRGIPAFHYMVAIAGGRDIRCAEYATFGSEALSRSVVKALEGRKACLMAQHGLTCIGDSPGLVLELAGEVEHLAEMYCRVLAIGGEQVLDDAEMDRVVEKFKDYRIKRG